MMFLISFFTTKIEAYEKVFFELDGKTTKHVCFVVVSWQLKIQQHENWYIKKPEGPI